MEGKGGMEEREMRGEREESRRGEESSFLTPHLLLTARPGFDLLFEAEAHLLLLHSSLSLFPWTQQHNWSPDWDLLVSRLGTPSPYRMP